MEHPHPKTEAEFNILKAKARIQMHLRSQYRRSTKGWLLRGTMLQPMVSHIGGR